MKDLKTLHSLKPNFSSLRDFSKEHSIIGVYCFSFETLDTSSDAHGRFFAPVVGVNEDPVTGTAAAALSCYLKKNTHLEKSEIIIEQGDFIQRRGRIFVKFRDTHIWVGGSARISVVGEIVVPHFTQP